MPQVFKQQSNKIIAFSFVGLIIVSQLMILNMGYKMPMYFLITLAVLSGLILWGMLVSNCTIDGSVLKSKVGPFVQSIDISKISLIKISDFRRLGSRKRMERVKIIYNGKKKLDVSPEDIEGFIVALKKVNPKIKIEKKEDRVTSS